MFKLVKKYSCILVLLFTIYIIITKFPDQNEHFRGFFQANPQISRNSSYDIRGGLNVNRKNPAVFGNIAGKPSNISNIGAFYGETIINN